MKALFNQGIKKIIILNGHAVNDFKSIIREIQAGYPELFLGLMEWFRIFDHSKYFENSGDYGYIVAPFTLLCENEDLNLELIPKYAEFIKRNGPDGVFVCGSTGEGALLTREERMAVAEKWVEVAGSDLKVIVHTRGTGVREQQLLAADAQKIGAWGIAALAPTFLAPKRTEEFVAYCNSVASAAPNLPFYYYHIPHMYLMAWKTCERLIDN